MLPKKTLILVLVILSSCGPKNSSTKLLGNFNVESDLFLAHFDCKTDVDDLHSVAGVATMLSDPRFTNVNYHAVAGAYGVQEGLYVSANELFERAFGKNWSDAHTNFDRALGEVTIVAIKALEEDGDIWIADAGQSDFTAALIRNIKNNKPSIETKKRIHVVQHSDWNESTTAPDNLNYVKVNSSYNKIPDGNVVGNGSPGYKTSERVNLKDHITNPKLLDIWNLAIEIADKYNGKDGRYVNTAIADGGLDFSDVSETCWMFGFDKIVNADEFFEKFNSTK